jgi:putative peptidoglycan lipid II flippase
MATPIPPSEDAKPKAAGTGFAGAALTMTLAIFASRVLGMVREMVIAHQWGPSKIVDSFYAAMSIPDFLYFLISGGALSVTLVPILTGYLVRNEEEEAWRVFSIVATLVATIIGVVIIACEIFARPIMSFFFHDLAPDTLRMSIANTRIVLPQALMLMLGGTMMGVLYSRKKFLVPAMAPVIYNIGIILGALLLGPSMGARGLAWGVLGGAFCGPVLMPAIAIWRLGTKFRPSYHVRHPGVIEATVLMLPVILGLSMPQLRTIITRWLAQGFGVGWITLLNYGYVVIAAPVAIFGQAMGVAVYPTLAEDVAEGRSDAYRENLSKGIRSILLITVPVTVLILVLRVPIVQILFERGRWTHLDTAQCAALVALFSIGIIAQSGSQFIARGFYALHDTLTPMIAGSISVVIFYGCSILLMQPLRAGGVALAAGVADVVNLACLAYLLRRKVGRLDGAKLVAALGKFALASVLMAAPTFYARRRLHPWLGVGFFAALGEFVIVSAVGLVIYLVVVSILKAEELGFVRDAIARRRRRQRPDASGL